jgi:hypothetical protein
MALDRDVWRYAVYVGIPWLVMLSIVYGVRQHLLRSET